MNRILKKLTLYIALVALLFLLSCHDNSLEEVRPNPKEDKVQDNEYNEGGDMLKKHICEMSLEQKIGQMVMVGIEGQNIAKEEIELIEEYRVGGFVLFSKNIENVEQTLSLINSLKKRNKENFTPLFFALDEEGGLVSRVPDGFVKIPSSQRIGRVESENFCFSVGGALARQVKALGCNMNFAPVLDIDSNPDNPVIGSRAFGDDIDIVSRLGIATMKGIKSKNIISVVKHFPGHGDTSIDSHKDLPMLYHDLDRLKKIEMVPFHAAIDAGADAIMIAHILLPQVDGELPSSLSTKIINDILRKDMGFEGVVITDDLTMGAITKNYNIAEASIRAVLAGSDIILVCHGHEDQLTAINSLKAAVEEGILTETRINESVYRILHLKQKYKLSDDMIGKPDIANLNKEIEDVLNYHLEE